MALLRSGIVLFVSVTLVASGIAWAIFYAGSNGSLAPIFLAPQGPLVVLSTVTLAACVILMVLARRARQQPLGDGIVVINLCVLGYCFAQFVMSITGQRYPDSDPMFVWLLGGLYMACLVPAYLICYLALRRTPLLRGLAPPPKSRGPGEASPLQSG